MKNSPNLDILRSIAVIFVLIDHIAQKVFGLGCLRYVAVIGTVGVCLFFVHTCTVLMYSLERDPSTFRFYVRRGFRIYPLSIFVVLLIFLMKIPVSGPGVTTFQHFSNFDLAANLLLIQNLFGVTTILAVEWSLPLELQMYLVLPFLHAFRKIRIEWLWVLSVILAKLWQHSLTSHPQLWRFSLIEYVPCFLPGIIAYRHSKYAARSMPAYLWPLLVSGVGVAYMFLGKMSLLWIACLVLGLAIPRFREARPNQVAHLIAKYSYGIYLTHVPALWLAFVHFYYLGFVAKMGVFIVTMTAATAIAYHAIEDPFIRLGKTCAENLGQPRSKSLLKPQTEETLQVYTASTS